MGKRILIVGGVAGGASAAARARRLDEAAVVISLKGVHMFLFPIAHYPII